MLLNFLETIAKDLVNEVIPPIQRYFTYFFIIIGIMWLGGANYYYYSEECIKFKGSLITGLGFLVLASITALWEYYINSKKVVKNNLQDTAVKILPAALPLLYNIFRKITLRVPTLKTLVMVGCIGGFLYYTFRNKDNDLN